MEQPHSSEENYTKLDTSINICDEENPKENGTFSSSKVVSLFNQESFDLSLPGTFDSSKIQDETFSMTSPMPFSSSNKKRISLLAIPTVSSKGRSFPSSKRPTLNSSKDPTFNSNIDPIFDSSKEPVYECDSSKTIELLDSAKRNRRSFIGAISHRGSIDLGSLPDDVSQIYLFITRRKILT
jgi:hypothetical protein